MKKNALTFALVLASMPATAAVTSQPTASHEGLTQFADLTENARLAASLETANHKLSRGYDVASAAPAVAPAAAPATPPALDPAPPQQGVHYAAVPPTTPDVEKPDTSAGDLKKKKNLQRAVMGGIGGAAVLAVFGFIFGGPIGAMAGAAIGFALLAGVTHLNNNPI